ncbi:MAG: hypothetical protein IKV50_06920 [Clostridia bacterium]|nr:hypothetical protein [Clostridia bacterium]
MKQYLLGADGGGSKTAFLLADIEGNPIATCTRGRSNPGDIGYEAMEALILEGFSSLCRENGVKETEIVSIFAGVAGLTSFKMNELLRAAMEKLFPCAHCDCSHDGMNVLYGAFPGGEDGAIVICGTGSSCFANAKDSVYRIGGYGQFDLTGNGYEIGKAAFAHVFRTLDGRDAYGVLAARLDEKFPGGCHKSIFDINGYTKTQFATFAPLVFDAAREGDPAAIAILEQNFAYIGELITTAANLYDGKPYSVALAGGIFKDPLSMEMVQKHVPAHATLFRLEKEPVLGAVAKAKHQYVANQEATPISSFLKNSPSR